MILLLPESYILPELQKKLCMHYFIHIHKRSRKCSQTAPLAAQSERVSARDKEIAEGNEMESAVLSGPGPLNYEHPAIKVDNIQFSE